MLLARITEEWRFPSCYSVTVILQQNDATCPCKYSVQKKNYGSLLSYRRLQGKKKVSCLWFLLLALKTCGALALFRICSDDPLALSVLSCLLPVSHVHVPHLTAFPPYTFPSLTSEKRLTSLVPLAPKLPPILHCPVILNGSKELFRQ